MLTRCYVECGMCCQAETKALIELKEKFTPRGIDGMITPTVETSDTSEDADAKPTKSVWDPFLTMTNPFSVDSSIDWSAPFTPRSRTNSPEAKVEPTSGIV